MMTVETWGNAIVDMAPTNAAVNDTINELDDMEDGMDKDSVKLVRKNYAEGFNAYRHTMYYDKRYLNHGDRFTKKWDDHLYLEAGAGVLQMVPPSKVQPSDHRFGGCGQAIQQISFRTPHHVWWLWLSAADKYCLSPCWHQGRLSLRYLIIYGRI